MTAQLWRKFEIWKTNGGAYPQRLCFKGGRTEGKPRGGKYPNALRLPGETAVPRKSGTKIDREKLLHKNDSHPFGKSNKRKREGPYPAKKKKKGQKPAHRMGPETKEGSTPPSGTGGWKEGSPREPKGKGFWEAEKDLTTQK